MSLRRKEALSPARLGPRAWMAAALAVLAILAFAAAACGDGDDEGRGSPTAVGGDGGASTGNDGGGDGVTVELTARDIQFDTEAITVPAGAHILVRFEDQDSAPHNFAVYRSEDAEDEIFVGDTITGPGTTTYEFDAPEEPGTYFFRCDVHPMRMTGDFVVE